MFRFIEVHLVYVGCNLHVIISSSVRKKVSVVSFPGFARCVNWSRQSTLLIKETDSLPRRAQSVNLSLLVFKQQLIMCVSNQTCQDGWTWAKFFFGVVFVDREEVCFVCTRQK